VCWSQTLYPCTNQCLNAQTLRATVTKRTFGLANLLPEDILYVLHSDSYCGFAVFPGSILCRRIFVVEEVCNNSLLESWYPHVFLTRHISELSTHATSASTQSATLPAIVSFCSELLYTDERTDLHIHSFTASIFLDSKTRIGQVMNDLWIKLKAKKLTTGI